MTLKRLSLVTWCVLGAVPLASSASSPAGNLRLDPQSAEQARTSLARGLDFLKNAQLPDGSWAAFQGGDPAITALAAKCFAQSPEYGPNHPLVKRAFDYVARFRQSDGGVYLPDSGMHNYYTSVALMALAHSPDPAHKEVVADAQKFLTGLQYDEGEKHESKDSFYGGAGYTNGKRPDLSNTQMMLEALHDSGLSPEHPVYQKALIFVSRCQMSPQTNDQKFAAGGNNGFIYTCAGGGESKAGKEKIGDKHVLRAYGSMTYAGLKSLLYANVKSDDPRVRAALDWIQAHYTLDANPNMPEKQAHEGLYYFYHVFAKALAALGQEAITESNGTVHNWRKELIAKLQSLQRSDGSWVNKEDRWWESNANLVTAYAVLALEETLK